ncbi:hypothetical protein LCGC14_1035460 [marine sediment metagenome]|uniref:Uncharacterized protein n=1 Tax=marine sediment metagenome TaxID=412755 RepID=A0A0F9QZF5_9ZZZZ
MMLNINDNVEMLLTEHGLSVLKEKGYTSYKYNFDISSGILREQLWVVMHIFSSDMYNGCEQLFVNNLINIKQSDKGQPK